MVVYLGSRAELYTYNETGATILLQEFRFETEISQVIYSQGRIYFSLMGALFNRVDVCEYADRKCNWTHSKKLPNDPLQVCGDYPYLYIYGLTEIACFDLQKDRQVWKIAHFENLEEVERFRLLSSDYLLTPKGRILSAATGGVFATLNSFLSVSDIWDGRYLATACDGKVELWLLSEGAHRLQRIRSIEDDSLYGIHQISYLTGRCSLLMLDAAGRLIQIQAME